MQYSAIKNAGLLTENNKAGSVSLKQEVFRSILSAALRSRGIFDEKFYISSNPDVAEALRNGSVESAADHYFDNGFFEGRKPAKIDVDEGFYLKRYPDVARGVRIGQVKSGQAHFDAKGFSEGRLPFEGFSLF